ncbi:MAG: cupin domain-containing protein [Lysobacterales bacterium]
MSAPIEVQGSARTPLGMSPARFLREYWQKQPLLIRQAWTDFACPLTPNDLAGLACEEDALARIVRLDRRRDRWHLETGPFAEDRFASLPARDWTLLVQDVDRWDADVARLLDFVHFLPRWRVDDVMVSYAVPGGSVGAHVDQYDVFLVQGLGQRRWAIDARPGAPLDFRSDAPIKLLQHFEASHEWVLDPGDVLYLPPGVPHYGLAETECLTLSIGMRAPGVGEMLGAWAHARIDQLDDALRYADPDLKPASDPNLLDAAALARVRAALTQALAAPEDELADWFGRFVSSYRRAFMPARRRCSASQWQARCQQGATLQIADGMRLCMRPAGSEMRVYGDGDAYDLDASAYALIGRRLSAADNDALSPRARAQLLELLRRGWLALVP